jgi:hypothetical protein
MTKKIERRVRVEEIPGCSGLPPRDESGKPPTLEGTADALQLMRGLVAEQIAATKEMLVEAAGGDLDGGELARRIAGLVWGLEVIGRATYACETNCRELAPGLESQPVARKRTGRKADNGQGARA